MRRTFLVILAMCAVSARCRMRLGEHRGRDDRRCARHGGRPPPAPHGATSVVLVGPAVESIRHASPEQPEDERDEHQVVGAAR